MCQLGWRIIAMLQGENVLRKCEATTLASNNLEPLVWNPAKGPFSGKWPYKPPVRFHVNSGWKGKPRPQYSTTTQPTRKKKEEKNKAAPMLNSNSSCVKRTCKRLLNMDSCETPSCPPVVTWLARAWRHCEEALSLFIQRVKCVE